MDKHALEQAKHEAFIQRFKKFLADDPYWVYLLTMEGGRRRRRQVAQEFTKMATTIPKLETTDAKAIRSGDAVVLNRALRRSLGASQRRPR